MKKILLVEDEILIQKSLQKLLTREGALVTVASSGKKAIEEIANVSFDLIICDLGLPDISGFDVIEESKRFFSSSEITEKFIIITAYSSAQVIEKASSYGCTVMSKPFDLPNAIKYFLS